MRSGVKDKALAVADKLPLAAIAGLTGFSVVAVALLLVDQFSAMAVWGLGSVAALVCAWLTWRAPRVERPGRAKEQLLCDALVLLGILAWGAWNIQLTAQHILTNRDPATYAMGAAWLSGHESIRIPSPTSLKGVENVSPAGGGFSVSELTDGNIQSQGQHVLPALLGAVGKVMGSKHVLHFNVLFGMTALLAMYCFGRLFMRSPWALLATAVLAFSLPMLYFSRDTYTEPLALTFTFGGLALLWAAQKNRRLALWALAGATVGAGVLTRVDGYLVVIGVAAFLAAYTVFAPSREYGRRIKEAVVLLGATAVVCVLAWLDLVLLSAHYYLHTLPHVTKGVALVALVIVAATAAHVVRAKYRGVLPWLQKRTVRWRPMAAALVVLALGVLLMSRPAWTVQYGATQNPLVAGLQEYEHSKVEPRGYAEMSTDWVSWYIGPVLTGLGAVGLAYAAYRSARDKDMLLLAGVLVVAGTSLAYFMQPGITPDQIWASRRMLPVIMPGLALFGAFGLAQLAGRVAFPSVWFKRSVLGLAAAGLAVTPLTVSHFFLGARDTTQFALVPGLCEALPDDAVVLWLGTGRTQALQLTMTYCGVDAYGYGKLFEVEKPSKDRLAEVAKTAQVNGKRPFVAVYEEQAEDVVDPSQAEALTQVSNGSSEQMAQTLTAPPRQMNASSMAFMLAELTSDGDLKKLGEK